MKHNHIRHRDAPTLRELYPILGDRELAEAEANLDRYLVTALRIWARQHSRTDLLDALRALTSIDSTSYHEGKGRTDTDNPHS